MARVTESVDEILEESFKNCRESMMIGWGTVQTPEEQTPTQEETIVANTTEEKYFCELAEQVCTKVYNLKKYAMEYASDTNNNNLIDSAITVLQDVENELDSLLNAYFFMRDALNNSAREEEVYIND